jgi:peptidoglycan/xylan/chitin deacetylase (PgdA/CDA1 family)
MVARRLALCLVLLTSVLGALLATPARPAAAARSRHFPATGHNVADPFLRFFEERGDLPVFGLPLTEAFEADGLTIQYFERARLEWHPELGTGQVAAGHLGREVIAGREGEPPFRPVAGAGTEGYFPETGHTLRGAFAEFWRRNGGLPVFGYPLSEVFSEPDPATGPRPVQYFERARFELHVNSKTGAQIVLLGLLGYNSFAARGYDPALLEPASPAPAPAPRALTIPVLEYHDVGFGIGTYQVTLPAFVQQLDWLRANGYTTVTLHQVYEYMFEGGDLPPRPVVITFDDGRASQWNAVRELNARGMIGVFFVLGGGNGLTDAQLRQMIAWGHEIEAHSMTHAQLSVQSDRALAYEVAGAKQALEAKLGVPIRYFAYPYGDYNARVIDAVIAAGYEGALAAWGGGGWSPALRWQEPRIIISGYASLDEFAYLVWGATP